MAVQPVSADMRFRNLESGMQGKDFDNLSYLFCFAVLKTDLQNFRFRIMIPDSGISCLRKWAVKAHKNFQFFRQKML